MNKKKVLIIVAHTDDETIWMGGTLIKNKNKWEVTIISLCRGNDKDRAQKFKKVCESYNAKFFMSNLEDETLNSLNKNEIIKRIQKFVEKSYDYIFTHGKNGEYGHIRHIETHQAVNQMIKDKSLKSKKTFFFAYQKHNAPNTDTSFDCYIDKNADKFISLNQIELLKKKEIIEVLYGFQKGGFEERNCRDKEAFNQKR